MSSTSTSRIDGLSTSVAVKAPVHAVATTNITLSGLQTVGNVVLDGTTLYRVLCTAQTDPVENGLWDASTGSWSRSKDFDGPRDAVKGTLVIVQSSTNTLYRLTTNNPIVPGTTALTFELAAVNLTQADLTAIGMLSTGIKYDITPAEDTEGVTIVNYYKFPGHLLRYGNNTTPGTTDMSAALQAALDSNTSVYIPDETLYFSGSVTPQSNSIVYGLCRTADLVCKDGNTNLFDLTGLTGVTIRGLKMRCSALTGTLGGVNGKALVYLSGSSQCVIEDNYIEDVYNCGIRLYDSSNNTVNKNTFGDWYTTGTANDDAANIFLMGASSYNTITGNHCLGADAAIGIAIHDYYLTGKQPIGNKVIGNVVADKRAYGILLYTTDVASPTGFDCQTIISHNTVTGILGSAIAGASGAGIYLQGAGGATCTDNTVNHCCQYTTDFGTLGMAHIIASITNGVDTASITVARNKVRCIAGPGIRGTSSGYFGIHIDGNTVRSDQTSSGNDSCIMLVDCRYSSLTNNTVKHNGPGTAIYVLATATFGAIPSMLRNGIDGNIVESVNGDGITIDRTSTGTHEEYSISNNKVYVSAASKVALVLNYMTHVALNGNTLVSNLSDPIRANNMTKLRGSGNIFRSNSTGVVTLTGTDGVLDASNYFGATMNNTASSILVSTYGDAAPTTGTWAVGDEVLRRTATVGESKGWRCTTAGTPGTWTSMGNL